MKFTAVLSFVVMTSLGFLPSVVHAESEDEPKVEIVTADVPLDFSKLDKAGQEKLLKALVHDAENASEGGAENPSRNRVAAFIKEYASKLNLPKIVRGMYRWYNVMEDQHPAIAADLSVLLLASHMTEMLSGPVGVALTSAGGSPEWVKVGVGVVGGIISIPGLDPLCMALGLAYVKVPRFRNGVTVSRIFIMKGVSGLRIDRFVNWFFQKQSRVDFIQNAIEGNPGKYTYLIQPSDGIPGSSYEFRNLEGKVFARVELQYSESTESFSVSNVRFDLKASESISSADFSEMLKLFNSNIRVALSKAFKAAKKNNLQSLTSEYHVTEVKSEIASSSVEVLFRPKALKLIGKRTWSEAFKARLRCFGLMSGSPQLNE